MMVSRGAKTLRKGSDKWYLAELSALREFGMIYALYDLCSLS